MKLPKIDAQQIDRVNLFVFSLSLYLFYAAQVFTLILIKMHFFPSIFCFGGVLVFMITKTKMYGGPVLVKIQ